MTKIIETPNSKQICDSCDFDTAKTAKFRINFQSGDHLHICFKCFDKLHESIAALAERIWDRGGIEPTELPSEAEAEPLPFEPTKEELQEAYNYNLTNQDKETHKRVTTLLKKAVSNDQIHDPR